MASPLSQLEARYLHACQNQKVIPNSSMVLSLSEAKYKKARFGKCILEICIDHLASLDIPPLIDTLSESLSDIDVVNLRQKSSNASLDGENLLLLFQAVNQKLQIVDLINSSSWKDLLRDICQRGMACQILNLQFSPIRKLNMTGKFLELQTLNLDSSVHLTSFHINCFSCMPKLTRLSMCETRVANLWTTTAALSKLHSLSELRFQNCSCCYDTGPCPTFGGVFGMVNDNKCSSKQQTSSYFGSQCISTEKNLKQTIIQSVDSALNSLFAKNCLLSSNESLESTTEELSDESDPDFSDTFTEFCRQNNPDSGLSTPKHSAPSSTDSSVSNTVSFLADAMHLGRRLDNSKSFTGYATRGETCYKNDSSMSEVADSVNIGKTTRSSLENHISLHPSPICFERYYREYIVTSLPHLKVLDNIPIGFLEREQAKIIFKRYFECAPYNRQSKDSIVSILQRREASRAIFSHTFSKVKQPFCRESNHSFLRSLSAAKAGSCTQTLHSISRITSGPNEESKSFRPRQFEYHPTDPRLMAFGTLDGELIVINHESEKLVGYLPSVGMLNSILALCWLKKHPTKILAGSDNGSLQLNDVCKMPSKVTDQYHSQNACVHTFHEFQQLTSVHVNSTDDYFLASGYSNHVALYDMGSGRRLQIFKDLHKEHINVVKFAHHSPSLFATASFDKEIKMWDLRIGTSQPCYRAASSRGNVMLCFSPDDYYLLTSAVDNEVRQLLAVDGRLHTSFDIPFTGNSQNYTRSYYINGRDYIISGSCEEHVVRMCCAQTGRRLRDVYLEGRGSKNSMYIQSLRGDPFRDFHMSILGAYWRPFSKSEIIKVNLLQSEECPRESTSI